MCCKTWTSGIIWTPCFSILFFQADNTGPVCVTLKPFMVEGHAVSHFKALVIFYQEPEDQDCCSFLVSVIHASKWVFLLFFEKAMDLGIAIFH